MSQRQSIKCPHCAESHPMGTEFCPNTGKRIKRNLYKNIIILCGLAAFFIGISFYLTPEDKDNNGPVKVEPEKPPLSEKTPEEKDVGADKDKIDERVRYAQKILKSELFLYNGKVDGKLDEDTEIAIKNFQGQNRLKRTGFIDDETWAALKKAGNSPPAINSSRQ